MRTYDLWLGANLATYVFYWSTRSALGALASVCSNERIADEYTKRVAGGVSVEFFGTSRALQQRWLRS
jgi:hypothetical protein